MVQETNGSLPFRALETNQGQWHLFVVQTDYSMSLYWTLFQSKNSQAPPIFSSSTFPWSKKSFLAFWDGKYKDDPEQIETWVTVIRSFTGTIVAGSVGRLFVFPKLASATPFVVELLDVGQIHTGFSILNWGG